MYTCPNGLNISEKKMIHCQDHILTENIWFAWSKTWYRAGERCHQAGRTTNEQGKIVYSASRLLEGWVSQFKLAPKTPQKPPQEPKTGIEKWFLPWFILLIFFHHFPISMDHFFSNADLEWKMASNKKK